MAQSCPYGRDPDGEVIFSFIDGFVWASWPGAVSMVRIGRYEAVLAAMHDFVAQCELGDRLLNRTARQPRPSPTHPR
jgi:hypothetical protein